VDYVFDAGKYGEALVLQGEWDDRFVNLMSRRSCSELVINYAKGFRGPDIAFLEKVPFLTSLVLIAYHLTDISPIHHLHNLRALNLGTRPERCEIDFAQFPLIEDCGFDWRPKARSLFQCRSLRRLWLNRYSGHDCSAFREMAGLRELYLASAPLRSITDLCALSSLHTLGLYYLTKLPSLDGIQSLSELEVLDVMNCRFIPSIEPVRQLTGLRRLILAECGDIASLEPLTGLHELEWFLAWGSTNVADGNWEPLTRLPHLEKITYMNRKHYSHRREEFPQYE
jgi:hypothetical protein